MLIEHLVKMANVLDSVNSDASVQASEGIDAVLKSLTITANDEIFQHLHSAAANLQAAYAKIKMQNLPIELKSMMWSLVDQLTEASKLYQINATTQEGASIHDDPTEEMDTSGFTEDESTQPDAEVHPGFSPSSWKPSHEPWRSDANIVLERLLRVADLFDEEGATEAATIIDQIVKDAVELPKYPSRGEVSEELYNAPKHNADNMWENVKQEVEENRKNHHLLTMRDSAPTLSTRYSPELPGVPTVPVAPGVVQDYLTKKIYDYNSGFSLSDGTKIPGGSVQHQTPSWSQITPSKKLFDDYENR